MELLNKPLIIYLYSNKYEYKAKKLLNNRQV